jgi:hypothetical protein
MTTTTPSTDTPRRGRRVRVLAILGLVLIGAAALALHLFPPSAANDIKHNPPPRLYADSSLKQLPDTTDARARGVKFAQDWIEHHPGRNDKAFAAALIAAIPDPPGAATTKQELADLHAIRDHKSASGDKASKWLEVYGKKKIWKLYFKQHKALLTSGPAKTQKQALNDALALATTAQATAKDHFKRVSPYQVDPTLRGLNQKKFSGSPKYSYPSKHAVLTYAAVGVLEGVEPHRSQQFDWMAQQVTYARMYGAGHYASDIVEGAFMGSAIGAYELQLDGLNEHDVRF